MPHVATVGGVRRRPPAAGRSHHRALLAVGFALITACGDARPHPDDQPVPPQPGFSHAELMQVSESYAPELDVDLQRTTRTESGLHYEDIVVGQGAVAEVGSTILVHYTGWLSDGQQFDSSRDRGVPMDVVIGVGGLIDGWDQGIPGMREGGRRRLIIPPSLGYGAFGDGSGVIPPAATLVFDIELVEVR